MTSTLTHPLVSAYLRDLELLLHGVEPGERAEVLAGVHEHLDVSLDPGASDEDVRRSLAELGSPQSVADEAYAGRTGHAPTAPSPGDVRRPPLSQGWVPLVVGLLLGLALVFIVFYSAAVTTYGTSSSSSTDSAGNVVQGPVEIQYDGAFPGATLISLVMTALLWFPPLFLCLVSPLWTAREKVMAALVLPLAAIALTALPDLGWALTGTERGISIGGWAGLALAVIGGGYALVHLTRVGGRRAESVRVGSWL